MRKGKTFSLFNLQHHFHLNPFDSFERKKMMQAIVSYNCITKDTIAKKLTYGTDQLKTTKF